MLNKIYKEQKKTNRNLQRVNNVILMAMFGILGRDAKEKGDERGKKFCKLGLCLIAVYQCLLLISDIADLLKSRNQIDCEDVED